MSPICPYCRTEVGEAEGERKDCPGCGTPHHADCFAENGGCTVFGCSQAPADEAKVTVTATDMMGSVVTRQVAAPASRPAVALSTGFTTFRAPALEPATAVPSIPARLVSAVPTPPPPPPPVIGSGVAPPPFAGPVSQQANVAASSLVNYYAAPQRKTRVVFVLLGIFLGVFGVHNFYAGYAKKGAMQIVATVVIAAYAQIAAWLWLVVWIWAIAEICLVNKDADGTQFV